MASVGDCPPGSLLAVEGDNARVVLANVEGDFYALLDRCSHQEFPLSDGELMGDRLECIYHGAEFDVCTGRAKRLPATRPVKTFPVDVRDGDVFIEV